MIESIINRLKYSLQFSKVHHPATVLAYRAGNVNLKSKRMPMQSCALMPLWHIGQPMRSLNSEHFKNIQGLAPNLAKPPCVVYAIQRRVSDLSLTSGVQNFRQIGRQGGPEPENDQH